MKQPLSLKGRALSLLAQREHSVSELRRKLVRHAKAEQAPAAVARDGESADPADDSAAADASARVEEVIVWLRAHNYLSEERFIESRIHARAARYGNLRIRQELAQHGLQLAPDAAQALKDSELERATDIWQRKYGGDERPASAAERAKQSRFLAARGFSAETIARVMRHAGRSAPDADPTS